MQRWYRYKRMRQKSLRKSCIRYFMITTIYLARLKKNFVRPRANTQKLVWKLCSLQVQRKYKIKIITRAVSSDIFSFHDYLFLKPHKQSITKKCLFKELPFYEKPKYYNFLKEPNITKYGKASKNYTRIYTVEALHSRD